MRRFLATLVDLCRFRRGPDDFAYAPQLLVALLLASAALQAAFGTVAGAGSRQVVATWVGGLAVVGAVYLLLRGRARGERFVQTAIALAAVYLGFEIVVDALALTLPLEAWREVLTHPGHAPTVTGTQALTLLVVLVLSLWQWCVWVRVLKQSLEIPLVGAVLILILLSFIDGGAAGLAAVAIGAV